MKIKNLLLASTIATTVAAASATPASAVVTTFATFSTPQVRGAPGLDFAFFNSGNTLNRVYDGQFYSTNNASLNAAKTAVRTYGTPGAVAVKFSFLESPLNGIVQNVDASLTATGVIGKNSPFQTINFGGQTLFDQTGFSGTFTFLSKTPIALTSPDFVPHVYPSGSVLLRAVFYQGEITGSLGGTSGSAGDSVLSGGTVSFSSDFLSFTPPYNFDLALGLTSAFPTFSHSASSNNHALQSFLASGSGQFSSDGAPVANGLAAVPEPTTWGLLLLGFGLVGAQARRRKSAIAMPT